ncbi:hypothetical protein PR048_001788 [Dryococelus australis]|uniref:AAA+ ATPase domain-containing protein n=1 Tax=Dryococelus australis TaxID=614101 RepID=A0ABQ9III0_9NEOP|nr:hypothetical protein PR048_001788 [Dryococelus australis]
MYCAGLKVSHGVLLYGPAGTGKTLVAEAVAAESGAFVSRVQAPEVFSKFVGETEARLREQFEVALAHAPSIVLLDEVECLCPVSGGHGTEQERRVAATLLTLLDDLQQRAERVLVIATTSRPDDLHPALRRPGRQVPRYITTSFIHEDWLLKGPNCRFDQELEVGVPSPEARLDILCKLLHSVSHQLTADDIRAIASSTHGFVGADLASLCAHAGRFAMRVSHEVTREDFAAALTLVKPSAMRKVLVQVPDVS